MATGALYIVATPIGNPADITLRALEILRTVDAIICEEPRQGSTLLKKLGLPHKELLCLNEHNEDIQSHAILQRLHKGEKLALISDCGTPVFTDPGYQLVRQVRQADLAVIPIPGPSSLTAALSVLDFKLERFCFAGFLPRQPAQRRAELQRLRALHMPIVLMDTPYRLGALLEEVARVFGKGQEITLACDLTLPGEKIYRGEVAAVQLQVKARKAEFVLIIHG